MFTDPKPKIPRLREILSSQFVFFHFETALEDFFGFGTADGDVDGDFFIASDAECADCVAGFACVGGKREKVSVCGGNGKGKGKGKGRELGGRMYCRRVFDRIIVRALWRHG